MNTFEERCMTRAISLAKQGEGKTHPNPLVGAVLEKDGKIIGEGFHREYGNLHAEREALLDCKARGNSAKGATLFVTLEPCCHFGKQPPCTQAIIESGIKKVVVASKDPNPLVAGKGIDELRAHKIEVVEGVLKNESNSLNEIFFHYITKKTPFVALKYAMTADGKIATKTGASKWITNECARKFVHELRNKFSSILVGNETVVRDNPRLTCRIENGKNPVRIVCDTHGKFPLDCELAKTANEVRTIVACAEIADEKKRALETLGVERMFVSKDENGKINLNEVLQKLAAEKIDSVLVEGGAAINFSFLEQKLAQKIYCFVGGKIFGGKAKSAVEGCGIENVSDAFCLRLQGTKNFGDDILLEYEVN